MKKLLLLMFFTCFGYIVQAQVKFGEIQNSADQSSVVDIESQSKGLLIPRMTTQQRDAIANPATGLLIFNSQSNSFEFYNGSAWTSVSSPTDLATLTNIVNGKADTTTVNTLTASIAGKADASALTALTTTVGGKADTTIVNNLTTTVNGKADTTAVNVLTNSVNTLSTSIANKADASALTALTTTVNGKADTATVNGKLSVTPVSNGNLAGSRGLKASYYGGDGQNGAAFIFEQTRDITGWSQAGHFMSPNMQPNQSAYNLLAVGKDFSQNNAAYIGFRYVNHASPENYLTLGLHSQNDIFTIRGNGNFQIGGNTTIGTAAANRSLTVNGNVTVTGTCTGCGVGISPTVSYNTNVQSRSTNISTLAVGAYYNNGLFNNSNHNFYQRFEVNGAISWAGNMTPYGIFQKTSFTVGTGTQILEPTARNIAWGYYIGNNNYELIYFDGWTNLFLGNVGDAANRFHIDRDNGRFGIGVDANASYKLNVGGNTQIGGNLQINGKINTTTAGTATLAGQPKVVCNTNVSENSIIILTPQVATDEVISVSAKLTGESFTIRSSNASSKVTVGYIIIN